MKLFPAAYSVARPASTPHFIQRTRHRRLPQLPQLPQLLGHSWRSCLRRLRPQLDARLHERKPGHLLLLPCSFFFSRLRLQNGACAAMYSGVLRPRTAASANFFVRELDEGLVRQLEVAVLLCAPFLVLVASSFR